MLLDAWSIPVCMFVCWLAMHVRYHWTQVLGVLICIGGLALLVTSDLLTGKNGEATRRGEAPFLRANLFTVNAAEEFFVRRSPLYEASNRGYWLAIGLHMFLLFGLFLFHYSPYWLYFVAFVVEILGLMVYFLHATPEDQGITNIELPRYLKDENKD
ncbi:hypothetical protein ID866_6701, partial [Astraeus odoratus]